MLNTKLSRYLQMSSQSTFEENDYEPFDIDFVGTGTYQVSQINLLQKRSIELKKTSQSQLSARGLHHRNKKHFRREAQDATAVINQITRNETRSDLKSVPYLVNAYFQRAVSKERLGQIDKAIEDFTECIRMDPDCAAAYFNRAGLYASQDRLELALLDMDVAVKLDHANVAFRNNRALLLRRKGAYLDAIKDTMISRAVQIDPSKSAQILEADSLDADSLTNLTVFEDPVVTALRNAKAEAMMSAALSGGAGAGRRKSLIDAVLAEKDRKTLLLKKPVEYLRNLKCLAVVADNNPVLTRVAEQLSVHSFRRGETVGSDSELKDHLWIVLEGEMVLSMSITSLASAKDRADLITATVSGSVSREALSSRDANRETVFKCRAGETFCILDSELEPIHEAFKVTAAAPSLATISNGNRTPTPLSQISKPTSHSSPMFPPAVIPKSVTALNLDPGSSAGTAVSLTAMVTQHSTLLCLPLEEYRAVINDYRASLREELYTVLDNNAVFATWEPFRKRALAARGSVRHVEAGAVIVRAGDPVRHLCIIRRGIVKLLKAVERPNVANIHVSELARPDSTVGMESPGLWVLEKNWKDRIATFDQLLGNGAVDFTVGVLGSGEVFGELSVLDPQQTSPFSVLAYTHAELYCFSSEVLMELEAQFIASTVTALDDCMNAHNPPGEKISYYFRSKFAWEKRKEKLLEDIARERQKLGQRRPAPAAVLSPVALPRLR